MSDGKYQEWWHKYYRDCWKVLKDKDNIIVDIPQENIEETFVCMSLCHSFILANSSFSLLAYYFRNNKEAKVCAPKLWFGPKGPKYKIEDLIAITENVSVI